MKVNTVGKILSQVDRAYIAGFLDGDGAIMATLEKHAEKRFGFRVRVTVKITQYHKHDVGWLVPVTRIGYIRSNRSTYEWVVRDQKEIIIFLQQIAPYSRCKKKQIVIAQSILQRDIRTKKNLYDVARLADTLSSFNVRSKSRRKNYAIMIKE